LAVRVTLLKEAVIVAAFGHRTRLVFTENVALVDPGATVTLDGTVVMEVLLLERVTTDPPAGAGPLSVTVTVDELHPVTLDGFSVSEVSTGGSTVMDAVCVTPLKTAEMTAVVAAATALVVTVNVVLVVPSAMVTVSGTLAEGSLLDKETTAPPVGVGPLSVTVPVEELPPVTAVGFKLRAERETTVPRLYRILSPPAAAASSHATLMFPAKSVAIAGEPMEYPPSLDTFVDEKVVPPSVERNT
jgi:hypothetical protein